MRKTIVFLTAILCLAITTSCNKEKTATPTLDDTTTSQDLTTLQDFVLDTENEIDNQLENRSPEDDCPVVTITPADGSFPRTVTIDYGAEGCMGPNGRVRKGQIIVTQTDAWQVEGATRTATFNDFFIDDVQLEGTKVWTNQGIGNSGYPAFSREVQGLTLSFPNGQTASWESYHTVVIIYGSDTPELVDDIYQITGFSSGTNRNGVDFSTTISMSDPLTKSRTCRWIESGTLQLSFGNRTRTIDYGEVGDCDRIATVTFANGQTREVLIRAWWR